MRGFGSRFGGGLGMLWCGALALAQHPAPAPAPAHPPAAEAAVGKRGATPPPTHAPQLTLPPALALQHLRAGHAAWLDAIRRGLSAPDPAPRPTGAGRHVVAILSCSDDDGDLPTVLGLSRRDVLWIRTPGPFLTPEVVAQLERAVRDQHLSLVLVVAHPRCASLAESPSRPPDALDRRARAIADEAQRRRLPLPKVMAQVQREQLLAASDALATPVRRDELRIVPAEFDPAAKAFTWHQKAIDDLPMAPVR